MKPVNASPHPVSASGWQVLGELQLALETDHHHTVGKWLSIILSPLELQEDFVNKVLKSARDALSRALPEANDTRFDHLHLLVFAPMDLSARHHSWGFFRIEKLERAADTVNPDHKIEFYLYLEQ
ncbi:MAG TPA: hypothetical protein VK900_17985 [Anaerolineales bacterium]|nr:hypothetical protein [Anaerolineales bacterium]